MTVQDEERFAAAAPERIRRCFGLLATASVLVLLGLQNWPMAAGFAAGAVASFISLYHLERIATVFTARAAGDGSRESSFQTIMRFLTRFALVTLGAYAIFRVSRSALYGYVAALFLPVAAMACEAAYEGWRALRRQL